MQKEKRKDFHRFTGITHRFRATCVYAILFSILTVMLEKRLSNWSLDSEQLGHCYRNEGIATIGARHPDTDQIYVAITAIWLLGVMLATVFGGVNLQKPLLICSVLQFPLHLYFMGPLRQANSKHLEGEESENDWDFGQTTAMLLLATVIFELFRKGIQYYKFKRDLERYGPEQAIIQAEAREDQEMKEGGLIAGPVGFVVTSLLDADRRSRASRSGQQEAHEMTQSLNRPVRCHYSEDV
jgi:hypothetical protein